MEFGEILRELRTRRGLGIKSLAPEVGVTYSYLSKLENGDVRPSEKLVERLAHYFRYDTNALLLSAGRVPADVLGILREHPDEAVEFLRRHFADGKTTKP